MGTKVHCESYLPGFYSMRDLNEDSSSVSWPVFYGDKPMANGQYYNGLIQRTSIDGHPGHGKDSLKQKMLEHEAVFKNQVSELHRLYRIQRDMMDEAKRKELRIHRASVEPASSSSIQGSQVLPKDAGKWHMAGFSLLTSGHGTASASDVEIANSPISHIKGNTMQLHPFPFQNGFTSKDSKALDSRPLKVRKKLFDLQLPAEDYIDTEEGEKLQEYKAPNLSSYAPNGNLNDGPESSMKSLFDAHAHASASASGLKELIGLVDLNDPIQIEEETAPTSVDFLGRTSESEEAKSINEPTKSNVGYLGINGGETIHAHDGFLVNSSIDSKVNDRRWLGHTDEAGICRNKHDSVPQSHQAVKLPLPFHPACSILNPIHHPLGTYSTGCSREDLWKEGSRHGLNSDGSRDHSNNSHLDPVVSRTHGSYPFFSSPSFTNSWDSSQPIPVWLKPTTSTFAQKVMTFEASLNSTAAMSRNLQPSWLTPGFRSESKLNGFLQASTSGSKGLQAEFPSGSFDYLDCSRGDNLASDRAANHPFRNFLATYSHEDVKPAMAINLNEALSNEVVGVQDLNTVNGKSEPDNGKSALPWLNQNPTYGNETAKCSDEIVRDHNLHLPLKCALASSNFEMGKEKEISKAQTVKKILGFPIFVEGAKNEVPPLASTSVSVDCHPKGAKRKNGIIDINVACVPDNQIASKEPAIEKKQKGACVRDYIDLNSSVSDFENPLTPCFVSAKITLEIDLEVPVFPENEDDNMLSKESSLAEVSLPLLENENEQNLDDIVTDAAETIVAISSSCPQIHVDDSLCHPPETSLEQSLRWFVDAVASYANELDKLSGEESRFKDSLLQQNPLSEMDDFEATVLQLEETKEEDYMPQPFVHETQEVKDDTGANTTQTRPRRGQSRRGRQRRDFQRDILPSLAMLSRHEVTEDIQTFGGLMRATGHTWNSTLTRRNGVRSGGTRGRRRAVIDTIVPTAISTSVCSPPTQPLNGMETGLEERSLTGWGKTTRRPRRQRCPTGNPPPPVALTH